MRTDPFDDLARRIEDEANAAGIAISVEHGRADGFGLTNTSTLDVVSSNGPAPVRVWDEGGGDVWFQLPEGMIAAWWQQDEKSAPLVQVVIALAEGRYSVESGTVLVLPRGHNAFRLRSQM